MATIVRSTVMILTYILGYMRQMYHNVRIQFFANLICRLYYLCYNDAPAETQYRNSFLNDLFISSTPFYFHLFQIYLHRISVFTTSLV